MGMRIIVTNKRSFQVIEWINVKSIEISGSNWVVTNISNVSASYAIADYNVRILGVVS